MSISIIDVVINMSNDKFRYEKVMEEGTYVSFLGRLQNILEIIMEIDE